MVPMQRNPKSEWALLIGSFDDMMATYPLTDSLCFMKLHLSSVALTLTEGHLNKFVLTSLATDCQGKTLAGSIDSRLYTPHTSRRCM